MGLQVREKNLWEPDIFEELKREVIFVAGGRKNGWPAVWRGGGGITASRGNRCPGVSMVTAARDDVSCALLL